MKFNRKEGGRTLSPSHAQRNQFQFHPSVSIAGVPDWTVDTDSGWHSLHSMRGGGCDRDGDTALDILHPARPPARPPSSSLMVSWIGVKKGCNCNRFSWGSRIRGCQCGAALPKSA